MKLLVGSALFLALLALALIFGAGYIVASAVPFLRAATFGTAVDAGNVLGAAGAFIGAAASLIGAIATLVVAYLIGYLYSSRTSSKQSENDVLLQVLGDVKSAFLALQQCSIPCHCGHKLSAPQKTQLLMAEREVSQSVYSLSEALDFCGLAGDSKLSLHRLKDARVEVKDSLTDSPYPGPYHDQARQRISRAFRVFRDEMNRLSINVIRR